MHTNISPVINRIVKQPHLFSRKEDPMSLQKLADELEILKVEYEKFERGNKSAGTRARKSLQNIKKICQEIRIQIQEAKKEKPE
jgi:transcriptional regulator with XRE-family HTH domain